MKQINESKKEATTRFPEYEQLLLLSLKLSDSETGGEEDLEYVESFEEKLVEKVESLDFALWDGHEYGGGYAKIFLYTSDVDKLYKSLYKTLKNLNFTPGSMIILQYKQTPMEHFVIDPNKLPD
jgi:hypothetical protein